MRKLLYTSLLTLSALAVNAQNPAIVFLHADAFVDTYEFLVLRRSNLTTFHTTDAGICSNGTFRTNEGYVQDYNNPGLTDVPAGTIVQVRYDNTGTADYTVVDGRTMLISNTNQLNQANAAPPGEQVIGFTGTLAGGVGCTGSGTNTFVAGINWGNAGWTSGATDAASSKIPGTGYDIAIPGTTSKVSYTGTVTGNETALVSNIGNPTNWVGVTNGDGIFALKNILFNESNYTSGAAIVTPATTSATLDLSSLVFGGTNTDTRYAVIITSSISPNLPVDRYTCYTGIAPTVSGSPNVVISVIGQTASNFCGTSMQGSGQIVYLDYNLPATLTITGLAQNTTYNYAVVAVNGNGYTANFSSTAYTNQFTTATPASTSVEVSSGSTSATVNENIGNVLVPVVITNPSPTVATTVNVVITGGTGSAADVNNFTTQTLTFPAGSSTSQNLTIAVTDDILIEGTETVIFTLQNVSGGQGTATIGANNTFTLTITDNDAVVPNTEVNFTIVPDTVIENTGLVAVIIGITNPSPTVATTVNVAITGGTGSAADVGNYTTQTITFPAGSSAIQAMNVTITDDLLFENTETIKFSLQNIAGGQGTAVIGQDSTFVLAITDNDAPNLVINEIHYNPSESSGSPDAQYEFIELYNAEPVPVRLDNYTFSQGVAFTFPANTTIAPSQYIIVAIDAATYSGQGFDVYQWASGDLDNNGETIEVRTGSGLLVDVVTYDDALPWPQGANNAGSSLQLIATNLDNALPQNWFGNGPKNGTPGNPNTPVGINENTLGTTVKLYSYNSTVYVATDKAFTDNFALTVIDHTGRIVGTLPNLKGNQALDFSNLPTGMYVVQCVSNSSVINQKVYLGN